MGAKYILRPLPKSVDDETQRYYAALVNPYTVSFRQLAEHVSKKNRTYSAATIQAVVAELESCLAEFLSEGHHVQIGNMGKLWLTLDGPIVENKEELTAKQLSFGDVRFQSSKRFARSCRKGKLVQFSHDTGITQPLPLEQRKVRLAEHLSTNAFITRSTYQTLTGLRKSKALAELHQFVTDGLLKTEGAGTRIVFVKK